MQIIPVIDLMGGCVVHARKGQRELYRPIQTPLCKGSSPWSVIDAFLDRLGFDTLYVADLDALMGTGDHRDLLSRLQCDYPGIQFWVDRGLLSPGSEVSNPNAISVIGSESLPAGRTEVLSRLASGDVVLSLDFRGGRLLGDESLLEDSSVWPDRVIIMSLSYVGANQGPDFRRLQEFRARWPNRQFFAAGGVRNSDDLKRLEDLGLVGVLLASALHSGAVASPSLRDWG